MKNEIDPKFYIDLYSNSNSITNEAAAKVSQLNDQEAQAAVDDILANRSPNGISTSDAAFLLSLILNSSHRISIRNTVINYSKDLRKKIFSNKVSVMAPIEISSYCTSNCDFCGWRSQNKDMIRLQISEQLFASLAPFFAIFYSVLIENKSTNFLFIFFSVASISSVILTLYFNTKKDGVV